jgi:acyl-coenzyme A thioesterase PaaI-like protein
VAEFVPGPDHVGWDNVTHGGILFAVLDDVMANWLFLQDLIGHTARCEVRYRQMLPVGTPIRLEGWLIKRRGRMAEMAGRASRVDDGQVVVECEARFILNDASGPDGS